MNSFYLKRAFFYGTPDGDPPPAVPPTVPPPPPVTPPAFNEEQQKQVNKLLAEERRKAEDKNKALVTQLEELRSNVNLTAKQKEDLDAQIQALQQQHLTKEQQQAAELEKLNKKYKTDTEALQTGEKKWRSNYDNLLIENGIRAGAAAHTAASPEQMLMLLSTRAKVVEEVDDAGKPTGRFIAKLPTTMLDAKTQKPVDVELPIAEAIGEMKKDAKNANLFLFDGKIGIGGNNNGSGTGGGTGPPDFTKMNAEQYQAWSKAQGMRGKR